MRVGLGTDGAGSNDSLDLLADLKLFALAQRHAAADATAIAVDDAWAIATGAKAPLLGATPLAVGEPADFLLLDPAAPELAIGELAADLVYAAAGAAVDTVVVAGRVLMRGGIQPERDEIVAKAPSARLGSGCRSAGPGRGGFGPEESGTQDPGVSEATRAGCGRLRDARDGRSSGSSVTEGREARHGGSTVREGPVRFVRIPCVFLHRPWDAVDLR